MNISRTLARIALLAATVSTCGALAALAQDAAPQGDAVNGKRVYLADGCFTCHGRAGQGGAYETPAPILARIAVPFESFKALVRNPVNDMPAFSDAVLSDKDLADVYAFVESLPGPRSPKDIPILNNN